MIIKKNVRRNKKTYKKEDKKYKKSKKNRNTRLLDLKKGDKVIYKRENIKEEVKNKYMGKEPNPPSDSMVNDKSITNSSSLMDDRYNNSNDNDKRTKHAIISEFRA